MSIGAEIIGYLATSLTAIASLPQVIKMVKTRDTSGLSLITFSILTIAYILWFVYGFFVRGNGQIDYPMVIGNAIGIILNGICITMKIVNMIKGKDKPVQQ